MTQVVRGEGWIPQFAMAEERVRARRDFPNFASLLAARGIDPKQTIILDGDFTLDGGKHEFLLVLPSGRWALVTYRGGRITQWDDDPNDGYSDHFQTELEKYRLSRQTEWSTTTQNL